MQVRGCGTALITPFQQDGSIDDSALRSLVAWQVDSGIDFLVPCGTTGETPTLGRPRKRLTDAERNALTERDALIGRPEEIIRRLKRLQEGGLDYVMVMDFAGRRDRLRTFAREVMPAFRG